MNYHCYTPFEGDRCPVCGSTHVRQAQDDDLCLVQEGDAISTGLLCDVLTQEEIPFFRQSQIGAAMAMLTGRQTEQFNVLVPYSRYEDARQIALDLSAPIDEDAAGDDVFDDYDGEYEQEDDE